VGVMRDHVDPSYGVNTRGASIDILVHRCTVRKRKAIPIDSFEDEGPWPFIDGPHGFLAGRFAAGWAYLIWIDLQNSVWIVSGLQVFPEPDDWRGRVITFAHVRAFLEASTHYTEKELIPPGGLTARILRRLPFRGLELMNLLMARAGEIAALYSRPPIGQALERRAQIAAAYIEALKTGSRKPNEAVAKRLGLKTTAVRDAVHRARRDGLLTQTVRAGHQGVYGGELTQKAIDLLTRQAPVKKRQK
jgi:hypothetical protein